MVRLLEFEKTEVILKMLVGLAKAFQYAYMTRSAWIFRKIGTKRLPFYQKFPDMAKVSETKDTPNMTFCNAGQMKLDIDLLKLAKFKEIYLQLTKV